MNFAREYEDFGHTIGWEVVTREDNDGRVCQRRGTTTGGVVKKAIIVEEEYNSWRGQFEWSWVRSQLN